jgi:septal ring-binding cell division protein DamX
MNDCLEKPLFADCSWGECFDYLSNIVHHSSNAFLVSGPIDSGKTTLYQQLSRSFPSNVKVFSMSGEYRIGVASFMQQITLGFGVDCNTAPFSNWDLLQHAMASQYGYNWVVIIDNAEKLSWDLLNALINLYNQLSAQGLNFSFILLADSRFVGDIKNSVLKDFFINKAELLEIQPLSWQQTKGFVLDYMKLDYDIKLVKKIYKASNGIIGKLKQLAISGVKKERFGEIMIFKNVLKNVAGSTVIRIAICGSLLLTAYVVFLITQKKDVGQIEVAIEQPTTQVTQIVPDITPVQLPAPEPTLVGQDTQVANIDSADYEQLYQKLHTDLKSSLEQEVVKLQQEISVMQNKITILSATATKLPAKRTNNSNNKAVAKNNLLLNKVETQLLNTDKNRYVLQLMASKNETNVKRLVAKYPRLTNKIKYFSGKFNPAQDTWFIVIHGIYDTPKEAKQDINNLPLDIQQLKPIVRNYKSVHQIINNKKTI